MSSAGPAAWDDAVLAALEFDAVLDAIAALTTCEPGRRAVKALRPLSDMNAAAEQQALVEDACAYFLAAGQLSLGGVVDVSDCVRRTEKGALLSGPDLRTVADAERALADVHRLVRTHSEQGAKFSRLERHSARYRDNAKLVSRLLAALEESGRMADGASPQLGKLRRQRAAVHDEVRERLYQILRTPASAKMLSEPIVTLRSGRYVVPVRAEFAAQLPGVAHDQSASGATVFIEPLASVEANNRLRALEIAEEREVARVLAELSALVGAHAEALLQNAELLADLDSIGARARWALAVAASRPQLTAGHSVRINRGRHPLLRREAVPLDIEVGERCDAVIISGPNMGGKTVVLKTVGLFCLLAYAGVPLPAAAGTTIGRFEHIACIIGDEQSIANDLSSFSAHLRALAAALGEARPGSLVLADELGSGTEPAAGAALAQAFVEALLRTGARVIVTTHYTALKLFAAEQPRVANASMLFDAATNQPAFVLAMGVPGQSLAFELAKSQRLDAALIARAEELLGQESRNMEAAFANLAEESTLLREKAAVLEQQLARQAEGEAALRERIEAVEARRLELEREAAAALDKAIARVRQELVDKAERSARDAARRRGQRTDAGAALERALSDIHRSLGLESAAQPGAQTRAGPPKLAAGDRVHIRSLGQTGIVSEVYERDVLVNLGSMKTLVSHSDVGLEQAQPRDGVAPAVAPPKRSAAAALQPPDNAELLPAAKAATAIDVRGMRVDEALPLVDKALDDASLAALPVFRVIHGKGTGLLRRAIRELLRDHPHVSDAAFAPDREGGTGVTLVSLR
jgi:DNA mismatch repair protein MutS2